MQGGAVGGHTGDKGGITTTLELTVLHVELLSRLGTERKEFESEERERHTDQDGERETYRSRQKESETYRSRQRVHTHTPHSTHTHAPHSTHTRTS